MAPTATIELKNIRYAYPNSDTPIFKNLNLAIGDERVGLIGSNGCGKTTLFQIMVGLIQPESGQLLFHGKEVRSKKEYRDLRKEVGFLFQQSDDQLFSPTVLEDVAFGPLNLGFSGSDAKEIALETLKDLGLSGFEDRITHRLSGGERKLVALATVLSMKPRLLLLDEPTNNLDPATRDRLITILKELKQAHLIISHDWDFLEETTNRLCTIDHGHIHDCEQGHVHAHRHIHTHSYGNHPHEHEKQR
jgi:cobalt/nickel transport system ATP-binding protein